jgi:hypothetical protein
MRRITVPASGTSFDEAIRGAAKLAVEAFTSGGVLLPFREEVADMRVRIEDGMTVFAGKVTFVSDVSYSVQVADGEVMSVNLPDDLLEVKAGDSVDLAAIKAELAAPVKIERIEVKDGRV